MDARICDRCGFVFPVYEDPVTLQGLGQDVPSNPDLCSGCRELLSDALRHFLAGGAVATLPEEDEEATA